jgi:hypothetical protein
VKNIYLYDLEDELNISTLERMTADFELHPLCFADARLQNVIPSEAVACSKAAMTILQVIYTATEERLHQEKNRFLQRTI